MCMYMYINFIYSCCYVIAKHAREVSERYESVSKCVKNAIKGVKVQFVSSVRISS